MSTNKKNNNKKSSPAKKSGGNSNDFWMPLGLILPVLLAFVLSSEPVEAKKVSVSEPQDEQSSVIEKGKSKKLKKSKKKKISSKKESKEKLKSLADDYSLLAYDDSDDSDDADDEESGDDDW